MRKLTLLLIAFVVAVGAQAAIKTNDRVLPAVPADPTADEWYDCGDESGFSKFYFTLPTTDVDGEMLDPQYLSYSIFIDNNQLFTFPAVDYTFDLEEDITEVPYSLYTNAVDFRNYFCYFYRTNAEGYDPFFEKNIGIQVYYTVDGVRNASHIAYLYELEPEFYVVGGFNDWNATSPLMITDEGATFDVIENPDDVESKEFKILTAGENDWLWLGGADENGVGYFEITDGMMADGTEITLDDDGANFRLPGSGNYTITLATSKAPYEGVKIVVKQNNPIPTAITDVSTKAVKSVKYVNLAGVESAQPFDGVNIVVTTYNDGTFATSKVIK